MPEGDTVWRAARHLNEVLAGAVVTTWDIRVPAFATSDLTGERIDGVVSRGKHLLHRVGDFSLHSHLKMEGSWHLYQPGSRWKRPAFQARALVGSAEWLSVGFDLGVVELIAREEEHTVVGHLGPDLLGEDWDAAEALTRLKAAPERPAAVALLDQRNLAGLGNVYANEICFVRGILPTHPIGETDASALVALSARLILANRDRTERTTTGDTRPGRRTWVYGRAGQPCRRCGTRIRTGELGPTDLQERVTYWCPRCQT
ncbi:Fpg/Nei family DNA glycosylase [Mycetocola manganoxydans]|uniref:DNA-(apurinic or apyrimidinic site) lyase n=1 Tax=Mycetocola manganoxydans TaxID=699879 RepID=A0A3L6ZVS0_9MICO|nr:DNA-formamidopyrimidine glycosylase family protein [Mycetocola manganoxydans]RLP71908.1 Fpg/Nei family DNA glycosylase [Mycetocola manganoxydans]GHD47052.1 putative DNA glycosylase Nei [Mycetocola manganoxydans]